MLSSVSQATNVRFGAVIRSAWTPVFGRLLPSMSRAQSGSAAIDPSVTAVELQKTHSETPGADIAPNRWPATIRFSGEEVVDAGHNRCAQVAGIPARSRQKLRADLVLGSSTLNALDAEAIRRAAWITIHAAICRRLPPGRERRAWLAGAQRLSRPTALLHYGEASNGRVSPCKQRSGI